MVELAERTCYYVPSEPNAEVMDVVGGRHVAAVAGEQGAERRLPVTRRRAAHVSKA